MPLQDFPLFGEESKPDSTVRQIMQGAMGNVLILTAAPTAAANTVPEKVLAYFNDKMYITINEVLKEWSVTSTA